MVSVGSIDAGRVAFSVLNDTDVRAVLHLWRILPGHSYEDLATFVRQERDRTEAGEPGLGPPSWIEGPSEVDLEPGASATLAATVRSGTYGFVCIREFDESGELHAFATAGPVDVA
jgi:hypothetical protein